MGEYVTWSLLFQYTTVLLAVVTVVVSVINHITTTKRNNRPRFQRLAVILFSG